MSLPRLEGLRVLRFACVDPGCEEVTELGFIEGARGPSFEEFAQLVGEWLPCALCGGLVRRFEKHHSEVEEMPRGAA